MVCHVIYFPPVKEKSLIDETLDPKPEDFDRAYIVLAAVFVGTVIWSLLSR